MANNKNLTLIFNTHIPHVLEKKSLFHEQENWIFESLTETYIPLILLLERMEASLKKNDLRIVLSFTPCTLKQLINGKERYLSYLRILKDILISEINRTSNSDTFNEYLKNNIQISENALGNIRNTILYYLERVNICIDFYENRNIIEVIKNLKSVELWTSTPNHNFLPMFEDKTINYFIKEGINDFYSLFHKYPDGFWLPECAYKPGIEDILINNKIKTTSLNINSIGFYTGKEKSGYYYYKGMEVLVHDFRLCKYLWKAPVNTLPSNPVYREFYRDAGLDLHPEYFRKIYPEMEIKKNGLWSGLKYHAITGIETHLGEKQFYDIEKAQQQVIHDAKKFYKLLKKNEGFVNDQNNFVFAFDTEFFGHWWLEGIWWLEEVLKNGR